MPTKDGNGKQSIVLLNLHGYGTLIQAASFTASIFASALAPYPLSSGLSVKTPAAVRIADMLHIAAIARITCNKCYFFVTSVTRKDWRQILKTQGIIQMCHLFSGGGMIGGNQSLKRSWKFRGYRY